MKKLSSAFLLLVLYAGLFIPQRLYAQASTEGKEFWVALNMTTGTGGSDHKPFICITTQHQGGSYTISNPADPSFTPITGQIPNNGYIKINASETPSTGEIDLNKWYPIGQTAPSMSCQMKNVGLKVTTTVESSVFVGNRLPQSFDAANILPITALQTEYITQDYPGYDHGGTDLNDGGFPVITILATENNTQVTINPSSSVLNSNGSATIPKTMNAGQVLYITGENRATLSGTTITSTKKIAVFTGVNNTDVPGPVSARDHLYEQNMPVDYWGTHFVVTRSMKKDANRIRVTAKENNTTISVDGYELATINFGETYEFELCSAEMRSQSAYTNAKNAGRGCEYYFEGYAHYLETSCPCAVFSYDVSEKYYISNGTSEVNSDYAGDPAMVWISPLEQQLRNVTFGVMNTDKTPTHYVNIITPTSGASSLQVKEITTDQAGQVKYGNNLVQLTDIIPVPGNTKYSYARIKLTENAESVYTITSDIGFIAHVYGSGEKESYAYSCGSAAVQQGIIVNGTTFTDGYQSDKKFCINDIVTFDAQVGTDDISRVDWDFGDGIVENESGVQTTHKYTSAGWYNVRANLYGHQVCTDVAEQYLGTVQFSIRVWKPQYIDGKLEKRCLTLEEQKRNPDSCAQLLKENKIEKVPVTPGECASDTIINIVSYKLETEYIYNQEGRDSALVNGKMYYSSETIKWTTENINGCDSFVTCNLTIITCLDMDIENDSANQVACWGEPLNIQYTKLKGEIDYKGEIGDKVQFVYTLNGEKKTVDVDLSEGTKNVSGTITLPTEKLAPGVHRGKIQAKDYYCSDLTMEFPIDITISYPDSIMKPKFGNTIALYQKGKGGNKGWDLDKSTFVWYHDGDSVATGPVYYTPKDVNGVSEKLNGEYYVAITTNGKTILSCPKTFKDGVEVTKGSSPVAPAAAPEDDNTPDPAKKVLQNRQIFIIRDGQTFNIYGQKVQ